MEADQIAILKNARLVPTSKGNVMWESGSALIAIKLDFEDLYLVNKLDNDIVHTTISASELTILEWVNKWKQLR